MSAIAFVNQPLSAGATHQAPRPVNVVANVARTQAHGQARLGGFQGLGQGSAVALAGAVGAASVRRHRARQQRARLQERLGRRSKPAVQMGAFAAGMTIMGTGSCAPDMVVTNDDLSEILDTSDEWISQRTGIRRRHVLKPEEPLSSIGTKAAQRAIEDAKLAPEDVDLVILASSTPDDLFGTAPVIAEGIGAKNAVAFDMTAACSGFVMAVVTAAQYIRSGAYKNVVVVGADAMARWVDWTDRGTCVLFGDGAGAVCLTATSVENDMLIGFEMGTDGSGCNALGLDNHSKSINLGGGKTGSNGEYGLAAMQGKEVFRFATLRVPKTLSALLKNFDVDAESIDWLLLHQANIRIMDSSAKRFGIPQEKIICNLQEYGNTSAASIPLALDEAVRNGKIKKGDLIASVGFGAGLSWAGMLFRF